MSVHKDNLRIGQVVNVSYCEEDASYYATPVGHSFQGRIASLKDDTVTVVDQDNHAWDLEYESIESVVGK